MTDSRESRVVGIGGIFFKARDPDRLRAWYRDHLGLPVDQWGGVHFAGQGTSPAGRESGTVWSVFPDDTEYLGPGSARFMINYRVDDLDAVLAALRAEGCAVEDRIESSDFGRFGWVADPEGNRVELWEPISADIHRPDAPTSLA
jgi:catechol 2,3-dioxygenase-like lactoylglutathione lyase family enzyme